MRVAVVGSGYWGRNHVRAFHALGALAAVVEPIPKQRAVAHSIAPNVPAYADLDPVLQDPAIRGIVIATPAVTHFSICHRCLEVGKDVLCEKPLAMTSADAKQLAAEATARQLVLMVGHVLEYHPGVRTLCDLVSRGTLGTLQYVYSHRLNLGKVRHEENVLWSFAPHDVAIILRLAQEMPSQVVATGGAFLRPNVFDVTMTAMSFDTGLRSHVFVSWLNPFKEQRLVVVGSERMVTFDDVRKELLVHDKRVDVDNGTSMPMKGGSRAVEYAPDEPLMVECKAFLDAMLDRSPPIADAHSAIRVLDVLEAAQQSLFSGGIPVSLKRT